MFQLVSSDDCIGAGAVLIECGACDSGAWHALLTVEGGRPGRGCLHLWGATCARSSGPQRRSQAVLMETPAFLLRMRAWCVEEGTPGDTVSDATLSGSDGGSGGAGGRGWCQHVRHRKRELRGHHHGPDAAGAPASATIPCQGVPLLAMSRWLLSVLPLTGVFWRLRAQEGLVMATRCGDIDPAGEKLPPRPP